MKDVLVTVDTVQTDDDGSSDAFQLTAEGKFAKKNGAYLIKYSDAFISGVDDPIVTTVKISSDNSVTVSRDGSFKSRFTLEEGRRCQCLYHTPFGEMNMGFYGEKIENLLNDSGGELKLIYTVDVNNAAINRNEMKITLKDI